MNFAQITQAFEEISLMSSNNEKLEWLRKNNDADLLDILQWYFDSSKITGIAEKKFDKSTSSLFGLSFVDNESKTFKNVELYLLAHNTGSDEDVAVIKDYMNRICNTSKEKECFKKLVCKNYPMGIDCKTINKVYPNLIPIYDVMLADRYLDMNENQKSKIFNNRSFVIQTKFDGFRLTVWKENGIVRCVSRQGKIIEGLVDIENEVLNLPIDNFIIDGEVLIADRKRFPSKLQYKETSKIVSTKNTEKHGVELNAFDIIPTFQWYDKCKTLPYSERYEQLNRLIKDCKFIKIAENLYSGSDTNKIQELLVKAKSEEEEGIMVRFQDSLYQWKRSKDLLKVKPFNEMDMVITGYEEGHNGNEGRLGALVCEVEHSTYGKIKCKVGGGYSDDERNNFWNIKDSLIGRIISVQYFEVTQNTNTKEYSIRFPEFLELKPEGSIINN